MALLPLYHASSSSLYSHKTPEYGWDRQTDRQTDNRKHDVEREKGKRVDPTSNDWNLRAAVKPSGTVIFQTHSLLGL